MVVRALTEDHMFPFSLRIERGYIVSSRKQDKERHAGVC